MEKKRPLSPHLQVYKPQLTSVLSILHRLTGVFVALGGIIIAMWFWSLTMGAIHFDCINHFLSTWFGRVLLLLWVSCTCYHLLNGIRHLMWDVGCGFALDSAYLSGKLVVIGTIILTALVWLL